MENALKVYLDGRKAELMGEQEDIDGEGNIPEACNEATYHKASEFVLEFYRELQKRGISMEFPSISLAWNGGVYMRIRTKQYDLLCRIYKDPNKSSVFTIDDYTHPSTVGHYTTDKEILFQCMQNIIQASKS
jgi:hypothetical protein